MKEKIIFSPKSSIVEIEVFFSIKCENGAIEKTSAIVEYSIAEDANSLEYPRSYGNNESEYYKEILKFANQELESLGVHIRK